MLADLLVSPELLLAGVGVVAAGWGISRSGAVAGWKSVAEARKERIQEIEGTLARAERREAALTDHVNELEALPDMAEISRQLDDRYEKVMVALRELKEDLNGIAERWG